MTIPAAGPARAALLLAVACGAPSRQLPRRIIDDPVTPPARMLQVSVQAGVNVDPSADRSRAYVLPVAVAYGLTDRLALETLTLRYALLDDAPPAYASTGAAAGRAPIALSIWGGLGGVGWQRGAGLGLTPAVGFAIGRRLHPTLRVWASGAFGEWIRRDQAVDVLWSGSGLVAQLTDFVTIHVNGHVGRGDARRWTRTHAWARRWGGGALGFGLRSSGPVTLFLTGYADTLQHELPPRSPPSPIEAIADQSPRHGLWENRWGWSMTTRVSW